MFSRALKTYSCSREVLHLEQLSFRHAFQTSRVHKNPTMRAVNVSVASSLQVKETKTQEL